MSGPLANAAEPRASPAVVCFWTVLWLFANMCTTLLNKAVFHSEFGDWKFPLCLSACHLLTQASFTLVYVRVAGLVPRRPVDRRGRALLLFFAGLFAANIVTGNAGLRYVTVSFSQICRALVPMTTVLFSRLVLGKTYPLRVKLSLVPILVGVVLAAYGEIRFHAFGFSLMMATVVLASLKAIYSNKFLTGAYRLEPLDLLDRVAPAAFFLLLPFLAATGEAARLAQWRRPPEGGAGGWAPPRHASLVLLSCAASLGLNLASFRYNQVTSPLSITVAGNAKEALTIVVSVFVFRNPISPLNLAGTMITIGGSCLYSYFQFLEMTRKKVGVQKLTADAGDVDPGPELELGTPPRPAKLRPSPEEEDGEREWGVPDRRMWLSANARGA